MTLASFRILGVPAPQGSKKTVGLHPTTGRPLMVESSKFLPKWRKLVKDTVALQWRNQPLDFPLVVIMTFTLPKPTSAPKTRTTWPDRKPDVSKLARAVEDSLTDAGVFADDARIVDLIARKRYPNEGAGALPQPGVVVHVFAASSHEADVFELDASQPAQLQLAG